MRILMFGRGVISTLYGWALEASGHHVTFYVRPGRAEQLGSVIGLDFYDMRRKGKAAHVDEIWNIRFCEDLPPDHEFDLILVSVQHYNFGDVARFLADRSSNATILIFNNFWEEPQAMAAALPKAQLAWGFPAAGGGFQPDGKLHGALFGKVEFGTFGTEPGPREIAVRNVFKDAAFKIVEHRDFRDWLWVHFATNGALATQVLRAGSMRSVMGTRFHAKQAIHNFREVMPLLEARGVSLKGRSDIALFRLPSCLGATALNLALRLSPALASVVDHHANPIEQLSFFRDVLDKGLELGIALPRFQSMDADRA